MHRREVVLTTTPPPSSSSTGKRLPAIADSRKSPYAPGALRTATDAEHERVRKFCGEHPEYERALGYEGLKQVAATYLDDDDRRVRGEMNAAGVRADWRSGGGRDFETGDFMMAEER